MELAVGIQRRSSGNRRRRQGARKCGVHKDSLQLESFMFRLFLELSSLLRSPERCAGLPPTRTSLRTAKTGKSIVDFQILLMTPTEFSFRVATECLAQYQARDAVQQSSGTKRNAPSLDNFHNASELIVSSRAEGPLPQPCQRAPSSGPNTWMVPHANRTSFHHLESGTEKWAELS
jgi:hypothetical protein